MGWCEDREVFDWVEDTVEVLGPFWTMDYDTASGHYGHFMLTPEFEKWCQNNLAGYWREGSGTIQCACAEDAMLLRLYMGGG